MAQAHEFEKVLDIADRSVASFEHQGTALLKRAQHFLHSTPAAVPLIVLNLSIFVFGLAIGGRLFSSYTLTLILQQIAILGAVLTLGVLAVVALVAALWHMLNHTAWSRHVYAVRHDPEVAKLSGIRTRKVFIAVCTLSGLIAGFAAWVSMGLDMLGADPQWKVLLTGVLIIGAVAIDQWIRKVSV